MINDSLPMKGELHFVLRDSVTKQIKLDTVEKNLVVATGKNFIASKMTGGSDDVMGYMAVGVTDTAPSSADTTLASELSRVAVTVAGGTPTTNTVTFVANFPAGTATGALVEAGIFNANSGGTMLSRSTYSVINKGALDDMTITWTITVG